MKISNMAEAAAALEVYYGITEKVMGKDITVERMKQLMDHLGNPERKLKVIHVAGTSGKTSTTYYIAALLQAAGKRVGHTVSPHVDSIRERVQLDGAPVSERMFCQYLEEFLPLLEDAPEIPTWFECLMAFALWVFAEEGVDYAVLETGLGGLGDASNVTERTDKLCVITDIGFDHMHILGNTLGAIAHQKAGIVHPGNTALMYEQGAEVMQVVRYWISQQEGAELLTFQQERLEQAYKGEFVADLPAYQRRNWLLSFAAYMFLAKRDEFEVVSNSALRQTQQLQVPGRMDMRLVEGKKIIMDGAHNGQKMTAFIESFMRQYPNQKVPVLLALKQGKEISDIAPLIARIASAVTVTTFSKKQDLPILSIDPSEVAASLQEQGIKHVTMEPDQHKAYRRFLDDTKELGVITGSFFLLSELREREGLA